MDRNPPIILEAKGTYPIVEAVSWVFDDAPEDHEWVSELDMSISERDVLVALNYDIEVLCVVQRGVLWFLSLSRQKSSSDRSQHGSSC